MVQIAGWSGLVEFLKETTYGSAPATGTFSWFGHVTKVSVKSTVDLEEKYRLRGADATDRRACAEVNAKLEHHNVTVEYLAQAVSSSVDWADTADLAFGATNGPADDLTSVVINVVASSGTAEYACLGALANTIEMSCEAGGDVESSIEFICQDVVPGTTSGTLTLDFSAGGLVHATEITSDVLDFQNTEVLLSGVTMTMCTGWSFKVDNKLEERFRLMGSEELPSEVLAKPRSVTGTITADLQDNEEYDRLLARTGFAIAILIGTKTVTFSGCKWGSLEIGIGPEDLISQSIPFIAETFSLTG